MLFQESEVEIRDLMGVLEMAAYNSVDHDSPPECAKMLRDIVFRKHLDGVGQACLGDPPASV